MAGDASPNLAIKPGALILSKPYRKADLARQVRKALAQA
jgi:hypothetical protein